jgi:hypothetical protein
MFLVVLRSHSIAQIQISYFTLSTLSATAFAILAVSSIVLRDLVKAATGDDVLID